MVVKLDFSLLTTLSDICGIIPLKSAKLFLVSCTTARFELRMTLKEKRHQSGKCLAYSLVDSYETGFIIMEGEMKENLGCFRPKNSIALSLFSLSSSKKKRRKIPDS